VIQHEPRRRRSWLIFDVGQNMKVFLKGAVLIALLGLARADTVSPEHAYGRACIDAVRHATACEAQRIAVEHDAPRNGTPTIKITPRGEPRRLTPDSLALLKRAFLRPVERDRATKFCIPSPGIRYLFRAKTASASILVCYKCRIAVVEENGRVTAQVDVDDVIGELRKVAESFLAPEEVAKLP
jgi:hypothetical protein